MRAPRPVRRLLVNESGAQAVEFALIAPLLLTMLFGIIQFGVAFNNYIELTEAARSGARNLSISRAIASATPYTTTISLIDSSAANLTAANITVTMSVNGTACASDSTCSSALTNSAGDTASVTATYPCNLDVAGVNFLSSCTMSTQTSDLVE